MFEEIANFSINKFFAIARVPAGGHSMKLVEHGQNLDCHKFLVSCRIENTQNSSNDNVNACDSIGSFEVSLDKYLYCLRLTYTM